MVSGLVRAYRTARGKPKSKDKGGLTLAKILYVDDDAVARRLVGERLIRAGFEVALFSDIAEARRCSDDDVSLYLCDGSVNRRDDGLEWAQELQASGKVVLLFSSRPTLTVPCFDKADYRLGDELVAMVRRLIE